MLRSAIFRGHLSCQWLFRAGIRGKSAFRCLSTGGRREPKLIATPEYALNDDLTLTTKVSGLGSREKITLHSELREDGMTFCAVGHYVTDDRGCVDSGRDPAVSGSYKGVEPVGLLWAMEQAPGQRPGLRIMKADVTKPFNISIAVHRGHLGLNDLYEVQESKPPDPVTITALRRTYMAEGVQRVPVRHGRVRGTLFIPEGEGPFPAVVDMFGLVKGIVEMRSALLASRGIMSLALPYVQYDDLPESLEFMDMDYFEEATEFLATHEKACKRNGVGVIAVCNGAIFALGMAAYIPRIKAAVSLNGCCFLIFGKYVAHKGQVVKQQVVPDRDGAHVSSDGLVTLKGACPKEIDKEYFFPLEKSNASFLFMNGLDDQCMPTHAARVAPEMLRALGKTNFEHIEYEGTGHLLEPPCNPHLAFTYHVFPEKSLGNMMMNFGGERHSHVKAQIDAWPRVLRFLKEKLA